MFTLNERTRFWDHKILGWENKRYERSHLPIARRAQFARQYLNLHGRQLRILDLGCGSGRLFQALDPENFLRLHGVDLSSVAIAQARRQFSGISRVEFTCTAVEDAGFLDADVVISLGLLDWLSDQAIVELFARLKGKHFLLSFSDAKMRWRRWMHQAFIQLSYGWRSSGYVPRYFYRAELEFLADQPLYFTSLPDHPLVGFVSDCPL